MQIKSIWSPSRLCQLLSKNDDEIDYYIEQIKKRNLGKRELRTIIKSKEYERLSKETRNKLSNDEKIEIKDLIPNPILINNKNNDEINSEKALHKLILEDIESLIKSLGVGYSFVGSEYKIRIGDSYNYIDFLLFNYKYNCFVVVELKVTELRKEHIGQIQVYMNYIDNNLKSINQDKTIGIIICKKDNKYIIEYCSDRRIISREYLLVI